MKSDNVVALEGRVSCEIDTADNMHCTELLLDGMFDALDVQSTIAIASVLLQTGEKNHQEIRLTRKVHHLSCTRLPR